MGKKIDLVKKERFGMLTVISEAGRDRWGQVTWNCQCDCGETSIVTGWGLRNNTKSCGCLQRTANKTHGMKKSPEYKTWAAMLQRCNNENDDGYKNYGGRGIKVCSEWLAFKNFFADMGEKPVGLTIERIDNDKGYYKENCCWDTQSAQQRNKKIYKNNKTGVNGVHWYDHIKKYQVRIMANNKRHHIGNYSNLEQAIIARKQAELKYW